MTFNSVYEITNPLTTVVGQRIIEDFSSNMTGNEPPNGWNLSNINGGTTGGTIYDSDIEILTPLIYLDKASYSTR